MPEPEVPFVGALNLLTEGGQPGKRGGALRFCHEPIHPSEVGIFASSAPPPLRYDDGAAGGGTQCLTLVGLAFS